MRIPLSVPTVPGLSRYLRSVVDAIAAGWNVNHLPDGTHRIVTLTDGVETPAAVTGKAVIYVDQDDGDLKVIFGDGFIRTIGADS